MVPEVLHIEERGIAHRDEHGDLHVQIGTSPRSAPGPPEDNLVRDFSDFADQFHGVELVGLAVQLELTHGCLTTYERAGLGPAFEAAHYDVRVKQLADGRHVARVPGGEELVDDFHVLLRHRLLRKPSGFEGLGSLIRTRHQTAFLSRHLVTNHCVWSMRRVAFQATAALAYSHHGHVSNVAHLFDLVAKSGRTMAKTSFHHLRMRVVAPVGAAALQLHDAGMSLHAGVA